MADKRIKARRALDQTCYLAAGLFIDADEDFFVKSYTGVNIPGLPEGESVIVTIRRNPARARVYDPVTITQVFEPTITVTG